MGRFFLLALLAAGAFVAVSHNLWEQIRFEEQFLWAAILPGVYLMGLALLRD